jgi:hypothetical protein
MASATPFTLCSRALVRVGANPISSFDDGTAESTAAGNEYELAIETALSEHRWNFATTRAELVPNGTAPEARWAYAYNLPGECLTVRAAFAADGRTPIAYGLAQGTLETDAAEAIVVEFLYRAPESLWPPYFGEYMFLKLASSFAMSIARNRDFSELLEKLARDQLVKAKRADAQAHTTRRMPRGRLLRQRAGPMVEARR